MEFLGLLGEALAAAHGGGGGAGVVSSCRRAHEVLCQMDLARPQAPHPPKQTLLLVQEAMITA